MLVADSYKRGLVNGLRHGSGMLVENAEANPVTAVDTCKTVKAHTRQSSRI